MAQSKFLTASLLGVALIMGSVSTASAATVYLRDTPTPTDHFVFNNGESLKRSGVGTIDGGNYWAGMLDFEMNLNSASSSSTDWFSLWTYCIDPFRALSVGPANGNGTAFTLVSLVDYLDNFVPDIPDAAGAAERISKLWANAFVDSALNKTTASAFQFLLWEYIGDGTYDPLNGRIRITNADVRNQATSWNNQIANWTTTVNLSAISGFDTKQSFIFNNPGTPTNEQVPEPGTYAFIGAGLLGLVYFKRR